MTTPFKIANKMFKSGQFLGAIDYYLKAIEENPKFFAYHQNLSMALIKAGKLADARKHIDIAKALAPQLDLIDLQRQASYASTPRLSIITPAHNTAKYLHQCIQSILNQTFEDFELIIVDDGSTDETGEIAKSFKDIDSRIKLIKNKHPSGNPGTPRNQALKIARGEYIGFVDSDDWIDENFYSELIRAADLEKSDIAFSSGFKNHTSSEVSIRKYNHENFDNSSSDFFRYHESFMIWDKIFRKSLLDKNQIWLGETKAAVDVPFIFKAYYYAKKICFCNELIAYNYRRETPTSVTSNFRKKSSCDFELRAFIEITNWAQNKKIRTSYNNVISIKKITSFIYTLGLISPEHFNDFFRQVKIELNNIDRSIVAKFSKEMKKGWVLRKFDQILKSTPEQYFSETRLVDQSSTPEGADSSQAKPKISLSGRSGIAFFPAWLIANPYQELFYRSVNRTHQIGIDGYAKEDFTINTLNKIKKNHTHIHLHWLHSFISDDPQKNRELIKTLDAAKEIGLKVIYTAHNIVSHEAKDSIAELTIRRELAKRFDIVIAHGIEAKRRLVAEIEIPEHKIQIMPHGTYCGYYEDSITRNEAREKLGVPGDKFTFLFFGNIREYKGVDPLISAFNKITENKKEAQLIIAGRTLDDDAAKSIASKTAHNNSITYLPGFVKNSDVQIYFKAADAFILPYERVLTSGAALLGLTFKKPVIAPRAGVLPEVISNDIGSLFDSYDHMRLIMSEWIDEKHKHRFADKFKESNFTNFIEKNQWDQLTKNLKF